MFTQSDSIPKNEYLQKIGFINNPKGGYTFQCNTFSRFFLEYVDVILLSNEEELALYNQQKSVLNFMAMGIHGDKTIYFADLTAIQYKPGGALSGHLQFSVLGGNESRGGVLSAASDENTITFIADKNGEAQKIHDYINNKLRELKAAKNAPIIQTAPAVSAADEIKKFKELLNLGILSQEEFDAKKKQLLGL